MWCYIASFGMRCYVTFLCIAITYVVCYIDKVSLYKCITKERKYGECKRP